MPHNLKQMMVRLLMDLVNWQHEHSSKVLQKGEVEREAFLFGHLAMVEKIMIIAIVMVIRTQFGHYQFQAQLNEVLCLGILKNVAQPWQPHTVAEVKKNVKWLQLICITRVQFRIQAHQHRLHWPLALLRSC